MPSDDTWMLDMLLYARQARERVEGVTREQFLSDIDKNLAVTHLVMIVGEAAAQVSSERRASLPEVPWTRIVGTRNRIVHHYFNVELDVIWEIVTYHLPPLIETLSIVVPEAPGSPRNLCNSARALSIGGRPRADYVGCAA